MARGGRLGPNRWRVGRGGGGGRSGGEGGEEGSRLDEWRHASLLNTLKTTIQLQ